MFVLKHLLHFGDVRDYLMILFGIFAAAAYAISHLLFIRLFGELVSLFVSRVSTVQCFDYDPVKQISNNTLDKETFHKNVSAKVIQLTVIGLVQIVINYLQYVSCDLSAARLANHMRARLLQATFAIENIATVQSGIGWTSSVALSAIIFVTGSLILALFTDWKLTLIVIIGEPLSVGAAYMLSKLTARTTILELESYGSAGQV
ncbi:unnamed protein product, partial [Adineta ricciae]